jgi:glycosyltransferase involved in cell wall biosynthesis
MHIGLIVFGGVDEGTEEGNPFPVFVEFIRRLAASHRVQVFSLQGANRVRVFSLSGKRTSPYLFAGAEVMQLGTARARRFRLVGDVLRVLATIHGHGPPSRARPRPQILHGIGQSPAVVATAAARVLGIPSVVSLIGGELTSLPHIDYGEFRTAKARAFMQIPLRYADAITVASQFMQKRVQSHGSRADVLPFGIDTRRFSAPVERPAGPPFRLLHVGTLYPVKDQVTLVRAIRILVDKGLDVELDIVGFDEWRGAVQRECAQLRLVKRVRFRGWIANEELVSLYRRAHVFVMASLDDVAPVAVLEAAASGLPPVGTDVGFIADWAPTMAIKTPLGDPPALAHGIQELLSSRTRREEMGRRAQAWVRNHASLEANDAYVALYENLLRRHRSRRLAAG